MVHLISLSLSLFLAQSNNVILLAATSMMHKIPPTITISTDSADAVQKTALDHFRASTITSYSEIRTEGTMVTLVLGNKEHISGKIQLETQ